MKLFDLHKERFLRVCILNVEQIHEDDSFAVFMQLFSITPYRDSTLFWGIHSDITGI